jgi:dihydroxyacetone kinase-like protein
MNGKQLNQAIRNALTELSTHSDELRDLDIELGDGDLGITVSLGSKAAIESLEKLSDESPPMEIAQNVASAFADANPSTLAALVAGALLSGSRHWEGKTEITIADGSAFLQAAGESIAKRGRSQVGDKTILDAIVPAAEALGSHSDSSTALDSAIAAAEKAVVDTRGLQSRRGRASWLQERSIGLQDPGATAFWYLLRAWKLTN